MWHHIHRMPCEQSEHSEHSEQIAGVGRAAPPLLCYNSAPNPAAYRMINAVFASRISFV